MKMHINRRNFLLSSLGATAITVTPLKVIASDQKEEAVTTKKYVNCGKMNSTNLRYFYHTGATTDAG